MKAFVVVAALSLACPMPSPSQEAGKPNLAVKSPLIGDGPLQQVRAPLEQIFQFNIDGGTLKADRKSWGTSAQDAKKNDVRIRPARVGELPIEPLFSRIQAAAGANSSSMSTGGRVREVTFTGSKMNGNLHVRGEALRMSLEEMQQPQRTLEYSDDGQGAFRLQVFHPDGDLIVLTQGRKGTFAVVALLGDRTISGKAESFVAYYRQHRHDMDAYVLPALASLGVRPIQATDSPRVRRAALALLLRTPQTLEQGKKLVADLDDDKMVVREKASRLLTEQFEVHKDLIQEKLRDKGISLEAQKRLQQIIDGQAESAKANQVVTALNLTQDPAYVASLLDQAPAEQVSRLISHLEKLTGQKRDGVTAWKEWGRQARSRPDK